MKITYRTALIVGAGEGLGASLARVFTREGGLGVILAARRPERLQGVCDELGAVALQADATDAAQVAALFDAAERHAGAAPDVVVYNASQRLRGAFAEIDVEAAWQAVTVTARGGLVVAREAARRMLPQRYGAILFTGASASIKGYAESAPFAMGKFALRGLAQSLARELSPQGIHIGHVIVDGRIRPPGTPPSEAESELDADAIARTYLHLLAQPKSAWSWEIEVRPWVERF